MGARRLAQVLPTRLLSTGRFIALVLAISVFGQTQDIPQVSIITTCESDADCSPPRVGADRLDLSGVCLDLGTTPTCGCEMGWYAVRERCKRYSVMTDVNCSDAKVNETCSQSGMVKDKCMVAADGAKKCQCDKGLTYEKERCIPNYLLPRITVRECNDSSLDCQWAYEDENKTQIEVGYDPYTCANYHKGKYCQCAKSYKRILGFRDCLSGKELASYLAADMNDTRKVSRSSRMRGSGIFVASTFTVAKWLIET